MSDRKPILCLDFDGVCHSYTSGWQGAAVIPDPPVPGLFEFLDEACRVFDVQIYSSRSHQEGGILAMQLWFIKQRALWREGGGRGSETIDLAFPEHKPSALVSLDDRGWRFTGSWPSVADLLAFKPWNRGGSVPAHPAWPASVHPYIDNREDLVRWIEQSLLHQVAVDGEEGRSFAEEVADVCERWGWEPAQTEPIGPDALAGLLQGVLSNLGLKD